MIKSIELENWKSFESAILYIDPLTILIGTNAAGKSNILDAFLFLHRIASGLSIQEAIEGTTTIAPLRGGLNWVIKKPANSFCIKINFDYLEFEYNFTIKIQFEDSNTQVIEETLSIQASGKQRRLYWVADHGDFANTIHYTTGKQGRKSFLSKPAYPVFRQLETVTDLQADAISAIVGLTHMLCNLFILDPIPSEMRGYSPLSKSLRHDASNIAGVLAAFSRDEKKQVEETITEYAKTLPEKDLKRIYTEIVGAFNTDAMLMCEEGWDNANTAIVDASGMSDGTLRYIAIVAALLTRPANSFFIIEEVDNGLHPSRAINLLDMLRTLGTKRNIDILITTHNPAILDAAGYKMIPFVYVVHRHNKTGFSEITSLDTLEILPKLMASGSLGDISTSRSIEKALHREVLP